MEEDGSAKVPMTRSLRRRLSVEQPEDTKSPSAPSTPTKKRGGRLAAKPQLELIDEHAVQNSPKKTTRKSIAREITESEEKTVTPSRRSTRIKSNTSLISENEDKPLTPSRRSTRIKSNTSLVAEATQATPNVDTPRAKRAAARRNSQLGSDTEAPLTPSRRTRKTSTSSIDKEVTPSISETAATPGRTRRTRKGSLTSIDMPAEAASADKPPLIAEVISEEPERDVSLTSDKEISPNTRKGRASRASRGRKSKDANESLSQNEGNDQEVNPQNAEEKKAYKTVNAESQNNISISSSHLINHMDMKPKKKNIDKNKSTSNIDDKTDFQSKRQRTKSWTSVCVTPTNEGHFYSDNESTKKKLKKHELSFNKKQISQADSTNDAKHNSSNEIQVEKDTSITTKSKRKSKNNSVTESDTAAANDDVNVSNESNKENLPTAVELMFAKPPSSDMKSVVIMEDSDSNPEVMTDKLDISKSSDTKLVNGKESLVQTAAGKNNDNCEPMDIDETIPENVSFTDINGDVSVKSSGKKSRNASLCVHEKSLIENANISMSKESQAKNSRKSSINESDSKFDKFNVSNKSLNKSKRKSSISQSGEELEKSENENRSTLVLSQIKDVSSTENNVTKSPRRSNVQEDIPDGPVNKTLMLNYQTSTPVQQKNIDKVSMQINTSVITPEKKNKDLKVNKVKPNKNVSVTSKSSANDSSDESEESDEDSENESSQNKSNFLDEAEDAGDYESGDSQDEEERQYAEEHEIVEKGETLTSEDDISNDSDYEKDSFIVSSDEEDNELLSGSDDDLNMSDNELTMSAKSKKKYNERKAKEQKKASKEMFDARHKMDTDNKVLNKKNRLRLDSSLLDSSEDNMVPPKKNKRMRLESAQTVSEDEKSKSIGNTSDEIGFKNKKKTKRLSESVCNESANNEKEITLLHETSTIKEDPLSMKIKPEPKTPQKDLDISTIHFTDREEIEEVEVNANMSIMRPNETADPLHTTLAQEEDSDDDSISENEEIAKNYDSILNELNKENKKLIKTRDISLNLNRKAKKVKEALLDELNLTQTRKPKKKYLEQPAANTEKRVSKKFDEDNSSESSDSIDLHLLFSDESNGGDKKNNTTDTANEASEPCIPLKRTPAKTNVRESIDNKEEEFRFFIDTNKNESLNTSTKKTHKKNEQPNINEEADGEESDDAPLEVIYQSNRDKTENLSSSIMNKTPGSERKKKKEGTKNDNILTESVPKTPASDKKKSKKLSESVHDTAQAEEKPKPGSDKKQKRKSESYENDILSTEDEKLIVDTKRVSKLDDNKTDNTTSTENEEQISVNTGGTKAKKRKRKSSDNTKETLKGCEVLNNSLKANKFEIENKKKKRKVNDAISNVAQSEEAPAKPKKRKERDEDEVDSKWKIFKENSSGKIPRLPANIINQLEDKPQKELNENRKANIVATTNFAVEETRRKRNKPSEYLEESVYLNDSEDSRVPKKKANFKKPKVLPFMPTVSTSDSGFTTNFQVQVISQKMEFVAKKSDLPNFKNDFMNNARVKKLRTYDLYKKHRHMKMSKF